MSTHYTPISFLWRRRVLFSVALLVCSGLFLIDGDPLWAVGLGAVGWFYALIGIARRAGFRRAVEVHFATGACGMLGMGIWRMYIGIGQAETVSPWFIGTIAIGLVAITIRMEGRIGRLEDPSTNARAADFPGIYRITCISNGKQYIGQTSQAINARWTEHRAQLAGRRHHNRWLQADWDMYRPEQFRWEVLEVVTDPAWLLDRERVWQDVNYDASKRYNPPNLAPRIVKASRLPMKRKR